MTLPAELVDGGLLALNNRYRLWARRKSFNQFWSLILNVGWDIWRHVSGFTLCWITYICTKACQVTYFVSAESTIVSLLVYVIIDDCSRRSIPFCWQVWIFSISCTCSSFKCIVTAALWSQILLGNRLWICVFRYNSSILLLSMLKWGDWWWVSKLLLPLALIHDNCFTRLAFNISLCC